MNVEELKEGAEHAHESGQKQIGLTMAIVAVLLAVATLLSHRAHTEEGLLQGKIVDEWNFYQAKHARAHEYGAIAEVAALLPNPNARDVAVKDYKRSLDEECGTPPEHGCSSPAKDSVVLRSLLADTNTEDGKQAKGEHGPAPNAEGGTKELAPKNPTSAEEHENKPGGPKPGANKIQDTAREMEHERDILERRADYYDASELFLEISIVLCSIALLAEMKLFWQLSFITTIIGTAIMLWGLLGLHYTIGLH
jgi:hypothetical protein